MCEPNTIWGELSAVAELDIARKEIKWGLWLSHTAWNFATAHAMAVKKYVALTYTVLRSSLTGTGTPGQK